MCRFQAQACPGQQLLRSGGLSSYEQQTIVNVHNVLRSQLATGHFQTLPPAANMQIMSWDNELAAIAQRWADQCRDGHDSKRDVSRFSVGQNVAVVWTYRHEDDHGDKPDWEPQIRRWFNEYHGFSSRYISPFHFSPRLAHFTQIGWADTNKVGCGYAYFRHRSRGYTKLYVCNYGPGGNIIQGTMYEATRQPTCTKPQLTFSTNFPGLCVSHSEYYEHKDYYSNQQFVAYGPQQTKYVQQTNYAPQQQQHAFVTQTKYSPTQQQQQHAFVSQTKYAPQQHAHVAQQQKNHAPQQQTYAAQPKTISRRLVANGLHSCRPLRRLPLAPPNRRQRLEWCRARSTWITEWHRVVFSDESRFCLSSDSRRVRVWRRRGERSNPAAIVERPTVRQRGIMVWDAIAYDSRSPLLRIQGTMTAQRYVDDVLRPVTLPYLQGVPNALYQQDNARPHTARISQQALQDVQMLPWPPCSPDLSPIEHVWDIIGRRLHALPQPRSEDELWQMSLLSIFLDLKTLKPEDMKTIDGKGAWPRIPMGRELQKHVGTCTAFIEVDLKTFRALGVRGRIVVDGVILNFEESIRARVCFRCCGFGHNSAQCTRAPKCFHCGEDGHEGRTCPSIADQRTSKCANCCSQGLPDKHEARASSCPILKSRALKF
ncbi:crispld1 [Cordylochernes scorpioides]|uniref:Crispld1 n=1 Tax=Cordylochernes scorpioides TaxID=51811 RepID=A0ABY6L887_9ARAC|nr:crispld1 [Cordylochernes scorpioides]